MTNISKSLLQQLLIFKARRGRSRGVEEPQVADLWFTTWCYHVFIVGSISQADSRKKPTVVELRKPIDSFASRNSSASESLNFNVSLQVCC